MRVTSRYAIEVKEVLRRTVIVDADSTDDAITRVEEAVNDGVLTLDYDDLDSHGSGVMASPNFGNGSGKVPEGKDVSLYCFLPQRFSP